MTTDITELAQSEINDALAQLKQISEYPTPSTQYARVLRKYILALVEALASEKRICATWRKTAEANSEKLEKAQQVDEELCKLLPPGVEYMDPPDGGDVTPLEGVRRMVADYRQRIAELESRTVKLPKLKMLEDYLAEVAIEERKQILFGVKLEFHRACVAAGIKVEAE